jgi:hypothetical protein
MAATKSRYVPFGLSLTQGQKETLAKAARGGHGETLRLGVDQLQGDDMLGLTKTQIAHITKNKSAGMGAQIKFSKTQLKAQAKMGGVLPLLALLPTILGGLSAAGALAGGAAAVTKAVHDKQANDAANAEAERHNREVEAQLKGSGLFLGKRGGGCPKRRGGRVKKTSD